MNALQLLRAECSAKTDQKINNFDDIEPGNYKVNHFELLDEKNYGLRLHVHTEKYHFRLPNRFVQKINQHEQVDELNAKKDIFMVYGGKDTNNFNRLILDFKMESELNDGEKRDDDFLPSASQNYRNEKLAKKAPTNKKRQEQESFDDDDDDVVEIIKPKKV